MKNIWTKYKCNNDHLYKHLDENSDEIYLNIHIIILMNFRINILINI